VPRTNAARGIEIPPSPSAAPFPLRHMHFVVIVASFTSGVTVQVPVGRSSRNSSVARFLLRRFPVGTLYRLVALEHGESEACAIRQTGRRNKVGQVDYLVTYRGSQYYLHLESQYIVQSTTAKFGWRGSLRRDVAPLRCAG
jgi:hypothetical protein